MEDSSTGKTTVAERQTQTAPEREEVSPLENEINYSSLYPNLYRLHSQQCLIIEFEIGHSAQSSSLVNSQVISITFKFLKKPRTE